jgi:hypothetical protein
MIAEAWRLRLPCNVAVAMCAKAVRQGSEEDHDEIVCENCLWKNIVAGAPPERLMGQRFFRRGVFEMSLEKTFSQTGGHMSLSFS